MMYAVKYWSDEFIIKYLDNKDLYVSDFVICVIILFSLSLCPLPLNHLFGLCFDVAELDD